MIFLELAQTEGGQIAGRLRQTALDRKGALQTFDAPLNGAANGDRFVGKLERSWIEGGAGAISGELTQGLLKVDGANGLRAQLRRGQESDYRDGVAALEREGSEVRQMATARENRQRAERALDDVASRIQRLVQQLANFATQEPHNAQRSASASQKYADVSNRMTEMLLRLRAAAGPSGHEIGLRSSLAASMLHASIEAEHEHIAVDQVKMGFESAAEKLSNALADATKACGEVVPKALNSDRLRQACGLVPDSLQKLNRVTGEVRPAYAAHDVLWRLERRRHGAMLREAEALKQHYDVRSRG